MIGSRHTGADCQASHCDECGRCGYSVDMDIVIGSNHRGAYLAVLCPTCSEAQRMAEWLTRDAELRELDDSAQGTSTLSGEGES